MRVAVGAYCLTAVATMGWIGYSPITNIPLIWGMGMVLAAVSCILDWPHRPGFRQASWMTAMGWITVIMSLAYWRGELKDMIAGISTR